METKSQNLWELDFPFPMSDLGPCELSCTFAKFGWVFWSKHHDELNRCWPQLPAAHTCDRNFKEKITRFLKSSNHYYYFDGGYLCQLWGLLKIGERMYLTTCDQPFYLTYYNLEKVKGLWKYRKHCLDYLIAVDEEMNTEQVVQLQLGPPGRVFRSGLPEVSSDIRYYTTQEYPALDHAINCGVKAFYTLPIFQPPGHRCIGVLEIVAINSQILNICLLVKKELEKVDLQTSSVLQFYNENWLRPSQKRELGKIVEVLKVVCGTHKLPFAQTWMSYSSDAIFEELRIPYGGQYGSPGRDIDSLRFAGHTYALQSGQGIVGKAFSSQTACFCRDVRQLSITEYPFVTHARQNGLSGCFAICLRSTSSDDSIYTLEFFLPINETNFGDPRTILHKLLATLIQHLQGSFKIAFGQELGKKLSVAVIKSTLDDKFDYFEICHTSGAESTRRIVQVQNGKHTMALDCSFHHVDAVNNSGNGINGQQNRTIGTPPAVELLRNTEGILQPHLSYQHPTMKLNAENRGSENVGVVQRDSEGTNIRKQGSFYNSGMERVITHEILEQNSGRELEDVSKNLDVSKALHGEGEQNAIISTLTYVMAQNNVTAEQNAGVAPPSRIMQQSSSYQEAVMVADGITKENNFRIEQDDANCSRKKGIVRTLEEEYHISHDVLEKYSAKKLEEVADILGVSRSTLKRICRKHNIFRWPPCKAKKRKSTAAHQEFLQSTERNIEDSRLKKQSFSYLPQKQDLATKANKAPYVIVHDISSIIVKATYRDDMIKFHLSLSSGKTDLEEEVSKRLNLSVGSFKIKYLDEDNDWVLVTCDADLKSCVTILRSLGNTTIRMLVSQLPIDNLNLSSNLSLGT